MRIVLTLIVFFFSISTCTAQALGNEVATIEVAFEDLEERLGDKDALVSLLINVDKPTTKDPSPDFILGLRERAENITLKISAPCIDTCSLLLLPLSDEVIFSDGGSAFLTSSILETKVKFMADALFPPNITSSSVTPETFQAIEKDYVGRGSMAAKAVMKLTERGKSMDHLVLHSVTYRSLFRTYSRNCVAGRQIAIRLDETYFREEFYKLSYDASYLGKGINKVNMDKYIAVEPYSMRVMSWGVTKADKGPSICLER